MAAITNYATLTSAISDWDERTYTSDQTDQFIALAEAEFRLYFGPNFAKETSATVSFTSGSGALPTGFVRPLSLIHATYGELTQKPIGAVRATRVWDTSGIPNQYAITGATIEVAPIYTGDLTLDYEGTLTGLSGSNTTNWLIANAPQAYLAMCLHFAKARAEDDSAPSYKASALKTLDDLGIQSMVAQIGRGAVRIHGATP